MEVSTRAIIIQAQKEELLPLSGKVIDFVERYCKTNQQLFDYMQTLPPQKLNGKHVIDHNSAMLSLKVRTVQSIYKLDSYTEAAKMVTN